MPNRLVPLLALAVALYGTGAIVVSLFDLHDAAAPVAATTSADEPIALLPAVVVRPDAEIPVLASITVRPERTPGTPTATPVATASIATLAMRTSSGTLVPSGGLDMPYYSFGRSLRRANKE